MTRAQKDTCPPQKHVALDAEVVGGFPSIGNTAGL